MAKRQKIRDQKDFPKDFWNYLVNPILGYYVPPIPSMFRGSSIKDDE